MFDALISDPEHHRLFVVEVRGGFVGYVLAHVGSDALPSGMIRSGRAEEGSIYLSKCYVDGAWHDSDAVDALIERVIADARDLGHAAAVFGISRGNKGVQVLCKRHELRKRSNRTFDVSGVCNYDAVMVHDPTA